MALTYPAVTDIDENGRAFERPGLRQRESSSRFISYELEYGPANLIPGGALETLAGQAFGRHHYWYILADVNKLRDPSCWTIGDKVIIPVDLVV